MRTKAAVLLLVACGAQHTTERRQAQYTLEGSGSQIAANSCKVYYEKWDGLSFNEGGQNVVRLEWLGQLPAVLVDALTVQGQTADHCWSAVVDASAVWEERWGGTLGRENWALG